MSATSTARISRRPSVAHRRDDQDTPGSPPGRPPGRARSGHPRTGRGKLGFSGRSRHAASSASRRPASAETWLLEKAGAAQLLGDLRHLPGRDPFAHTSPSGSTPAPARCAGSAQNSLVEKVPSRSWGTRKFSVPTRVSGPRLVAVAVPGAPCAPLVARGSHVRGHLRLQNRLQHPLHDLLEEGGIVQQDAACAIRSSTLRLSSAIVFLLDRVDLEHLPSWRTVALRSSGSPIYRTLRAQPRIALAVVSEWYQFRPPFGTVWTGK